MSTFEPPSRFLEAVQDLLRKRGATEATLADGIQRLSELFVERRDWTPDYLALPGLLSAYIAYYLPVNALKVRWILGEMKRYAPGFLDVPRRVLDFGCGPGTALLGLAESSPLAHDAFGVDRVREVLGVAEDLVSSMGPMRVQTSTLLPEGRFDLIFASNVLSELETTHRIDELLERLDPSGFLIIVEPALQESTLRLMAFRDELAGRGLTIAAPCPAVARCPMRSHADLWCHMELRWNRPGWIARLDGRTGLQKDMLKFSYLVITRSPAHLPGTVRVVSHLHRSKGRMWAWLCGGGEVLTQGELLSRHVTDANREFRRVGRGEMLEIPGHTAESRKRFDNTTSIHRA